MNGLDKVLEKYENSQKLLDRIRYLCESLSLDFDKWDQQHVTGPSLYFLIVASVDFEAYADPMGENTWPTDRCSNVHDSADAFPRVARDVAFRCDGAVVVTGDGTIQQQMMRVRTLNPDEVAAAADINYPDWMGSKHMSALETTLRKNVLLAVTLSEETGRVTTFVNGTYQDYTIDEIGGRWRPD
jgi:diadenylate cyclase